jgi:hypothetical protein
LRKAACANADEASMAILDVASPAVIAAVVHGQVGATHAGCGMPRRSNVLEIRQSVLQARAFCFPSAQRRA